jgi:polysaccharide biosynthesis/export protein
VLTRLDALEILMRNDVQDTPAVTIMGAVRKPGVYGLSVGLTLRDLLRLAGEPTGEAFAGQSTLVRRLIREDRRQFDVKLMPFNLEQVLLDEGMSKMSLKNHDQIIIRRVQSLQVKVQIEGRVQFPGTYILPDGAKISDLLVSAGGLLKDADLRAAIFTRERIRTLQEEHLDWNLMRSEERFARTRDEVTRDGHVSEAVANHMSLLGLDRVNRNMLRYQALGRVVIDLTAESFPDSTDNLSLESGDRIVIPRLTNTVMVMGRVFNPNAFVWNGKETVGQYLDKAGGFEEDADRKHVYLIMASGLVRSMSQSRQFRLSRNYVPGPGDTVIVPAKPLGRSTLRALGDHIALARSAAELGIVGVSVDKVSDSPNATINTGLELGSSPQANPVNQGRPYDEMLIREKALRDLR